MRYSRGLVVAFLAAAVVASAALHAADHRDSNGDFYFSDGSKIVLVPSSDWVALRFDPAVASPAEIGAG